MVHTLTKTHTYYACEYCGCECATEKVIREHEKICGANPSAVSYIRQSVIGRCFRRGRYTRYFSNFRDGGVQTTELYSDPISHVLSVKSELWDTEKVFELIDEGEEISRAEFFGMLESLFREVKKW